jgi:hypothetical protein
MNLLFLVPYTPYVLILGGVAAASWIVRKVSKPAPVVGASVSSAARGLSIFGFFVGILMLATAAGVWLDQAWDSGTRYLLIVTGLSLILKPLKDIPWAALVGLIVGGLCVGFVYIFYPLPNPVLGVSSNWVYLAIFLVSALVSYLLFKFVEDLLKVVAFILANRPVKIILGILCLLQGILLLLNTSLFTILLS